jgi:hypothetical protein
MVARTKPLSRVLDALALLLGLPQWDKAERRIVLEEIRPRLVSIAAIASRALELDTLGQRIALRTIEKMAQRCIALVDAWAEGDVKENTCHEESIAHLRQAAGELDRR